MRYALLFALSIIGLTAGALVSFDRISISGAATASADTLSPPTADTLPTPGVVTPAMPTAADYARYAAADQEWRESHAKSYTLAELRARGDGKRTARDSVEDRVFQFVRSGQRPRAIADLERWVKAHPADDELLLSLARLLTAEGRSDDAIGRYRQILALHRRAQ
jgi:tetratricopeptide (TPR) repeat protein